MRYTHHSPIVLFDGVCNLCNGAVQFILKYEKNKELKFCPLQSEAGAKLLLRHSISKVNSDSIILIHNGKAYTEGEAVILIAVFLKRPWSLLTMLRFLPGSAINFFYRLIAKYRYRIFGKRATCYAPTESERGRFVDDKEMVNL